MVAIARGPRAGAATALLNRGKVPDTLMILLLVLAADATVSAIRSGRLRTLIVAGILVGLASGSKMIEAWLVLPALALAYLVGGDGPPIRGRQQHQLDLQPVVRTVRHSASSG